MSRVGSTVANRPAETATGVTAAVVAALVATTHLGTGLATVLVVLVGALPGLITGIVSATRSTAAGLLLVSLTPKVRQLADGALDSGLSQDSGQDRAAVLKDVTHALASWTSVLSAESGATAANKLASATAKPEVRKAVPAGPAKQP